MPVHFRPKEEIESVADEVFARQRSRVLALVPSADVQHVGATAVPGALTKGDLDLVVRVPAPDFAAARERLSEIYGIHQPESWDASFASFVDAGEAAMPVGVQLVVIGSDADVFVSARDRLRAQPDVLRSLNALKAAHEGRSHEGYRAAKSAFFAAFDQRVGAS